MTTDALDGQEQQDQQHEDELEQEDLQTLGDEREEGDEDVAADDAEAQAAFDAAFQTERAQAPSRGSPANAQTPTPEKDAAAATETATADVALAPKNDAAPAAETPAPASAEDPWKDVHPVVRAKLEELGLQVGGIQKLEHRLKSAEGRIAAFNTGKAAARDAAAAGGEAPNAQQIERAIEGGGEKWKQLAEQFPDWADALEERIAALPRAEPQHIDVDAITEHVAQRTAIDPEVIVQHVTTELKHPGWKKTLKTDEFKAWYQTAPADIRAAGASDSADDAIKVLDAFKAHTARQQIQQRSTSRLEAATAPTRGTGGGPVQPSAEQAFDAGFNGVRNGGR